MVRLNLNEFQVDLSPKVIAALRKHAPLAKQYVYLGDEPTAELQRKIADYVGVESDEIVLDEALDQAFNRLPKPFIQSGDNIVAMAPTYPELILGVERCGGRRKMVPAGGDLLMDAEQILEAIDDKTKMVFVCSPNNPTSAKMKRDDILKVVENAKHSIVVVDECYYEYCGETVADTINEYANLYVARSFSKGFGLAGGRMAYLIASKENCEVFGKVLNGFELNRFGVFGAIAALGDLKYYRGIWKKTASEKLRMRKAYEKLGFKVWDSFTSFTFMDISSSGKTSTEARDYFLKKYKILIRDVSATFTDLDKKYVSFGTGKPETNSKLIKGFKGLCG
jgi:histidinol-phosphate aminotransferase